MTANRRRKTDYNCYDQSDPNMPPWSYWVAMAVLLTTIVGWTVYAVKLLIE